MNEDERLNRNLINMLLCGCIILIIVILFLIGYKSPKFYSKDFTESIRYEEIDSVTENVSSGSEESVDSQPNDILPININTATAKELESIPDIGPATAKLIIEYRNEYGTIVSFSELLSIKGIGEKTLEIIKEYCIIN